ncbi:MULTISPECIES: WXG100 family type VII secretion target [Amycolatopsis]|uniref:Uncharacterized conserved protein YukE n=2 Tax=Amycolatopsis TaxID=1813 RepID=A0A1I3WXH9_9PSEU|nr:WXG100 family type VII secretion target [Amycolatopsis sacchari]SFK12124.1 Uncharacterized conserved protein YukE [Amycolatopsis sacchari]
MIDPTTVPIDDPALDRLTFDQLVQLLTEVQPDVFYREAAAFDRAADRLREVLDQFRAQARAVQENWTGTSSDRFVEVLDEVSGDVTLLLQSMREPGYGNQLRLVGDALANAQQRLRDLQNHRAATPPTPESEQQFTADARRILHDLAVAYRDLGLSLTELPGGQPHSAPPEDVNLPTQTSEGNTLVASPVLHRPLPEQFAGAGGTTAFTPGGFWQRWDSSDGFWSSSQDGTGEVLQSGVVGVPEAGGGASTAGASPAVFSPTGGGWGLSVATGAVGGPRRTPLKATVTEEAVGSTPVLGRKQEREERRERPTTVSTSDAQRPETVSAEPKLRMFAAATLSATADDVTTLSATTTSSSTPTPNPPSTLSAKAYVSASSPTPPPAPSASATTGATPPTPGTTPPTPGSTLPTPGTTPQTPGSTLPTPGATTGPTPPNPTPTPASAFSPSTATQSLAATPGHTPAATPVHASVPSSPAAAEAARATATPVDRPAEVRPVAAVEAARPGAPPVTIRPAFAEPPPAYPLGAAQQFGATGTSAGAHPMAPLSYLPGVNHHGERQYDVALGADRGAWDFDDGAPPVLGKPE